MQPSVFCNYLFTALDLNHSCNLGRNYISNYCISNLEVL